MPRSLWTLCRKWLTRPTRPIRRGRSPELELLGDRCLLSASPLGSGKEIFVAPAGDDWNAGTAASPYLTIRRALDAAESGDIITLRNGVYEGGINIDVDNLTIRSAPGEWAVVESPLTKWNDGHAESVFRYDFAITGGRLENLEITGGYYYGVMLWDWWDSDWSAGSTHRGASGVTIEGCKIHDTGVDAVKITPGCDDISILNNEIFNAGRRTTSSADGIDNNNGDRMIARGNYIHDIPSIGILTTGGTVGSVIEQNLIKNVSGAGLTVGYYSESEWMEPATNPTYITAFDTVARNNIVIGAKQAGIGIYAAQNALVANNTLIDTASEAQAPIQLGGIDLWLSDADWNHHVASVSPVIVNNIITTSSSNTTRMVDIRQGSVDPSHPLTLDYNIYFGTSVRGILFIDRNLTGDGTPEQTFSGWRSTYGYDLHSMVGDPFVDATGHLSGRTIAWNKGLLVPAVSNDFDGSLRDAAPDIGADELSDFIKPPPAPFGSPSIEIGQRAYHNQEGDAIVVRVVRNGSVNDTVTVAFTTMDGSAKAGLDYTPVSGVLTFGPGEIEQFVVVPLAGDALAEGDEHFLFTLSNPTTDGSLPVRLGHQSSASMTIDDAQTPLTVHYRTLFVAPEGSDISGDGSADKPWKSLQHAADSVGAGDFVIVKPGLYTGMNISTDGKPDARITFHAMPGVVIDEPNPENNQDGINLEGADFVTIEGFEIHGMPRAGLRSVLNDGAILRNNITDDNEWWGILTGWSENVVVENNVASRSRREHGIYISNSADGAVVRGNIVWGNNDSGIQFNADAYLPGDGVHSHNLVENNVIYDNGLGGGAALNFDGFQDSIVRNNLLYNNHATGIVLYVGYAADSSINNLVENNTIIMADDARWALLLSDGSFGNTIVNNILLNRNPNRGSITVENGSEPAYSDHNVFENLFQIDGVNTSFAAWQAFTGGMDAHSFFATESDLFVDPAANDYRLKAGSPAIDVGDPFHAPEFDLYGHVRGVRVDIGALEAGTFTPSVQFDWADSIAYEATGMAEIVVTRTGDTAGTLTVDYATGGGTATPGSDYTPAIGQLVFGAGETRKAILVLVNNDTEIESFETVDVTLLNAVASEGPATIGLANATLHIQSDDQWKPGTIAFDTASVNVDEAAGVATITVRRTDGANGDVSVRYVTGVYTPGRVPTWIRRHTDLIYPVDPATPASADDYGITDGTLSFADGETEKTITVPIVNDAWYEGIEAFLVHLTSPTGGAALGKQSQVKVRIQSDDVKMPGTFVWGQTAYSVTEGTPAVAVTVHRVGGANAPADVRLYHTGAGSGDVKSAWDDYGSVPQLLHFEAGETSKTISIPILDDANTEGTEAFSIKLYAPTNDAAVGAEPTTVVTIFDNESTFYFSTPDGSGKYSVKEGDGFAQVKVIRQGANGTPASLRIKSSEWSSATPGVDFTPVNVIVNFAPGEAFKIVNIPIVNDTLMEPAESFPVSMSECVGAQQGSWTASVNIIDDDVAASPGSFELSSATYGVAENAGSLIVTVKRVGGSDGTVSVKYRTSDGASGIGSDQTAWAGSDYSSSSGVLTFAPGETTKTFAVPITNDTSVEKNEFFSALLSEAAGGAKLGAVVKATVTLQEDDSAIEFGATTIDVSEGAGFATLTLVRKGSTAGAASVDLAMTYYSGTPGKDLVLPANPTVTFADGESVKTIVLPILEDSLKEGTESFGFTLKNPLGAKLGSSLWATLRILDND